MSKMILLIEDEAIIALSTAKSIEKHRFTVKTAYSGESGEALICRAGRKPNLKNRMRTPLQLDCSLYLFDESRN